MTNREWYEIKAIPYAVENIYEQDWVKFHFCTDPNDSYDTLTACEVARNKLGLKYGDKYSPDVPVRLEYSAL